MGHEYTREYWSLRVEPSKGYRMQFYWAWTDTVACRSRSSLAGRVWLKVTIVTSVAHIKSERTKINHICTRLSMKNKRLSSGAQVNSKRACVTVKRSIRTVPMQCINSHHPRVDNEHPA